MNAVIDAFKCVLKKNRKSRGGDRSLSHVVQLQSHPLDFEMTPAMKAGIAVKPWTVKEIIGLLEKSN